MGVYNAGLCAEAHTASSRKWWPDDNEEGSEIQDSFIWQGNVGQAQGWRPARPAQGCAAEKACGEVVGDRRCHQIDEETCGQETWDGLPPAGRAGVLGADF